MHAIVLNVITERLEHNFHEMRGDNEFGSAYTII